MNKGKVRTKARTVAKKKERELIARAKRLRDGLDPVLPECDSDCGRCPFDKWRARLAKIRRYKDNMKKLTALANRGPGISRAYAAALLLAKQEKAPYLAVAHVGAKDIAFAQRGKVKQELLIGFQHYHDPDARLLAVSDTARRRGLFIYSTRDKMICTGPSGKPPKEYLADVVQRTGYPFSKANGGYEALDPSDDTLLEVKWVPAKITFKVSRQRSSTKRNISSVILNRMLHPQNAKVLDIRVSPGFTHSNGGEDCPLNSRRKVNSGIVDAYLSGKISDREIIDMHLDDVREKVEGMSRRIYAVGMVCFDDDQEAFIDSLRPNDIERVALTALLDGLDESVMLDDATPAKVLDTYWEQAGLKALEAVLGDEEAAKEFYDRSLESDEMPSVFIQEAFESAEREKVLSELPEYKRLPPVARFCDRVARIHRIKGPAAAAMEVRRDSARAKKFKALEYAFLLAMREKVDKWRYTDDERGFGQHLKPKAKALLAAEPEDYDEKLHGLLAASGHSF